MENNVRPNNKINDEFQSDFDKSLSFMTAVADSKPIPIQNTHNHTFKNTSLRSHTDDLGVDLFANDVAVDHLSRHLSRIADVFVE